jgi:NADPH-dependent 2,4-dienoyl-CoA reductase/sulfur reductase-like enzyme
VHHGAGVLIVGGSLGGLTVAESLRAEGYEGAITIVSAEHEYPYSRPALSKQVLARDWEPSRAILADREALAALRVEFLQGAVATALDMTSCRVRVNGAWIPYETLVIATGAAPRRLPQAVDDPRVHAFRTMDDAVAMLDVFDTAGRIAVIGTGILGCEITSEARAAGVDVSLIGRGRTVAFGGLGHLIGDRVERLLGDAGVDVRLGTGLRSIDTAGDRIAVGLDSGHTVMADAVLAAIGCTPEVGWLEGGGLDLSDGVLCDATGAAAPGIYAVGDVARWPDHRGTAVRVEHQASAIEQAHVVARAITGGDAGEPIVPFFWSELFGTRILAHGTPSEGSAMSAVAGDLASDRFVSAVDRDGEPVGLIGWNMAREFRQARAAAAEATSTTSVP